MEERAGLPWVKTDSTRRGAMARHGWLFEAMHTPSATRAPAPTWPLIALAAAVLGAHLALLLATPSWFSPPRPAGVAPLQVRQVDAPRVAPAAPPAPPAPPAHPARPDAAAIAALAAPVEPREAGVTAARVSSADPTSGSPASAITLVAAAAPAEAAAPATTAPAVRAVLPPPMRLRYALTGQVRGLPLSGHAELAWRHDGHQYEALLDLAIPLASRSQRSAGRVTAQGLAPLRYAERTRSEEAAHFDRAHERITFSGNRPDVALAAGAQDRLSVLLQLGALVAGEPAAFRAGRVIAVQTATTRDAELWHFSVEGEEELALPGGRLRALHLLRLPRKEFDQRVELWLAPALDYAPVRLRLTQSSGDWLEQQWSATDRN